MRILEYVLIAIFVWQSPAVAADGAEFQRGDLIISSRVQSIFGSEGIIGWYHPDGTLNRELYRRFSVDVYPGELAFGPDRLLYVTSPPGVLIFDRTGVAIGGRYVGSFPQSAVFDALGNLFVSDADSSRVVRFAPDGRLVSSFVLFPGGYLGGIDLGSDQCTMYATQLRQFPLSGTEIIRYDVCDDRALPSLAVLPESANSVRVLADGSILASNRDAVRRIDASGQTMRTYDAPGVDFWHAVAVDITSSAFWAGSWDQIYKFDLESGAVLAGPIAVEGLVGGITVVGAPRAAAGAAAAIPTTSGLMLLALGIALAAVSAWRIR